MKLCHVTFSTGSSLMLCINKQASLAVSVCLLLAVSAQAAVIVSEVHSTGSSASYMGDWFELTNTGGSAVAIAGWKMDDSTNLFANAVTLDGVSSIAAGQSVVFMESPGGSTSGFLNAWFGGSPPLGFTLGTYTGSGVGLGSGGGGDEVNIFDGSGVPQASVSFGAATPGVSFDNAAGLTGPITQLSSVGVNGAFTSNTGGEIGSPGTIAGAAVPEPGSALLFVLGGIGASIFGTRRRK